MRGWAWALLDALPPACSAAHCCPHVPGPGLTHLTYPSCALCCAPCRSSGGREQPPLPATAQVAFQQADYVAWNLWAAINSKPLLNFRWGG